MSDSVSKYYEDLEAEEWWAKKAVEKEEEKPNRFLSFLSNLLNIKICGY